MTKKEEILRLRDEGKSYREIVKLTGYNKSTVAYYCNGTTKTRALDYQQERRLEIRKYLNEYKSSKGCTKCGENHPAALDFHHLDKSDKEFNISVLSYQNKLSQDKIDAEISKCIVLCANCHRKLHYDEGYV